MKNIVLVLVVSITLAGCGTPYRMTNMNNSYDKDLYRDQPTTVTKGRLSVTAGGLTDSFNQQPAISFLVNNASGKPVGLTGESVKLFINGEPVGLKDYKWAKKYARMEKFGGALGAASGAFNRSISGGYNMTEPQYQLSRTDHGVKIMQSLDDGMQRVSRNAVRQLEARSKITWEASLSLRQLMMRNFSLIKKHYLKNEQIAAGHGVLRIVYTDQKQLNQAASKNPGGLSPVDVRLTVGRTNFDFKMILMQHRKGQSLFYRPQNKNDKQKKEPTHAQK